MDEGRWLIDKCISNRLRPVSKNRFLWCRCRNAATWPCAHYSVRENRWVPSNHHVYFSYKANSSSWVSWVHLHKFKLKAQRFSQKAVFTHTHTHTHTYTHTHTHTHTLPHSYHDNDVFTVQSYYWRPALLFVYCVLHRMGCTGLQVCPCGSVMWYSCSFDMREELNKHALLISWPPQTQTHHIHWPLQYWNEITEPCLCMRLRGCDESVPPAPGFFSPLCECVGPSPPPSHWAASTPGPGLCNTTRDKRVLQNPASLHHLICTGTGLSS